MKNVLKVESIMSDKLITLHPKDKIQRAKDIFDAYDIHHIPIVVMNKPVGIISLGDILYLENLVENNPVRMVSGSIFNFDTVDQLMTQNPICAAQDSSVHEVLTLMLTHGINAIPVTEKNELVGLVTSKDLLHLLKEILSGKD